MEVLRNLTKEEAAIIVDTASFLISNEFVYKESSLSLQERLLLQELGLMLDDGSGLSYEWSVDSKSKAAFVIDDDCLFVISNDSEEKIKYEINIYKLTTVGKEIYKLVSADKEKRNSFYKTLARFFHEKGKVHISKHKIVKLNNNDSQVIYKQNGEDI